MELAAKVATLVSTIYPVINKWGRFVDSKFGCEACAEHLSYLNDSMTLFSKIPAVIGAAEWDHSDQLMPLMEELQSAAFEAEDLLDQYEYEQIENQVSSSFNTYYVRVLWLLLHNIQPLHDYVYQAEKIYPFLKSVTDLTKQNHKMTPASSSIPTTSTTLYPYFGRVKQIDNIIKFLLDESPADSITRTKKVSIISIRGMGGSGKSVTAQCIFNDVRVNAFKLKMWVHVARNFDVHRLTKKIIESAKQGTCIEIDNLDVLQWRLKKLVSKRKFLLVLDDVWCTDEAHWDLLLGPLNEVGENGSKIIITTRMQQIATILDAEDFPLGELKTKDCWSILKHYAFINSEETIEDKELEYVGNQIINKVKFSPLALKIVACSLREKRNFIEWEKILKQDMLKETMDLLLFSFRNLPTHLQRCFAYCSLFPKGYQFAIFPYYHEKQLLIPLWIAQGYVENTNDQLTVEEKGSEYIEELISYSFFEKRSDDYFVIHDLLHDLAEMVSKKQCHRIENFESLHIPSTCIHLSIICRTEVLQSLDIIDILKFENLRTLIILDYDDNVIRKCALNDKKGIFLNLLKLRALYVQDNDGREVINDPHLHKLKHLRYLHVRFCLYGPFDEKLPRSLTELYYLQFCHLMNMRLHLEKDSVNAMMSLKNLPLCGSLSIESLENIKSKEEAAEAMLNQKKNLNELTLVWSNSVGNADNSNTFEEVLEALEPPSSLVKLRIKGYQGVNVANWIMKENWLLRLRTLHLWECESLQEVPYLPPRIEELHVRNCVQLMQLPFVSNSLLALELENCPNLTSAKDFLYCTSLKKIDIRGCPIPKTDEFLLVKKEAEGDTIKPPSHIQEIGTDEPLLVVPILVQQQTFNPVFLIYRQVKGVQPTPPIRLLELDGLKKPFPPLLEECFYQLTSLKSLILYRFTTLPEMCLLYSLEELTIESCYGIKLLPKMPKSLISLSVLECDNLNELYEECGVLRHTISHIPYICVY